ncbi:putative Calcium-dependent protein kinase 34, partial [Cardiosporidium cionae]
FKRCSAVSQDFIRKLLLVNPSERLTAMEALRHPWLLTAPLKTLSVDLETLHAMKRFAEAHKFKQAALSVMAANLNSEEIQGLHDVFLAFDKTKEGTIRLAELKLAMQKRMEISEKEVAVIFNSMDSSGDEQIYYSDFLAAMLETRLDLYDGLIRSTFEKFDVDHSGYVTLNNLKEIFGDAYMDVTMEEIIKKFDKTGDGRLDYEEFLAAIHGCNNDKASASIEITKKNFPTQAQFFEKIRLNQLVKTKVIRQPISWMTGKTGNNVKCDTD